MASYFKGDGGTHKMTEQQRREAVASGELTWHSKSTRTCPQTGPDYLRVEVEVFRTAVPETRPERFEFIQWPGPVNQERIKELIICGRYLAEPGPEPGPEERVRIWVKKHLHWWGGSIERATMRRSIGQSFVDKWPNDYEIRPVEKPPEKSEMVRVLDREFNVWWVGRVKKPGGITSDIAKASLYSREALRGLRLDPELYEFQPVEKPEKPERTRVVVELAKGDQPHKPEVGGSVTLYVNAVSAHELGRDVWVGTVVEIEGEKP